MSFRRKMPVTGDWRLLGWQPDKLQQELLFGREQIYKSFSFLHFGFKTRLGMGHCVQEQTIAKHESSICNRVVLLCNSRF